MAGFGLAPAQALRVCAGAFIFCAAIAGCDDVPRLRVGNRSIDLDSGSIQLDAGVKVHDIKIKSMQNGDFAPAQVAAKVGDIVRFTTTDTRTHALVIQPPDERAGALLDSTGQRRSPPLVTRGQAWIVSLKDLPAGTYTLSCISHTGTATIQVQ